MRYRQWGIEADSEGKKNRDRKIGKQADRDRKRRKADRRTDIARQSD